jgi:hypothetical protein
MASEAEPRPPASVCSTSGCGSAVHGDGIDLEVVERELRELLRGYGHALQYAADMPWLGRSLVKRGRPLPRFRWRFGNRAYVEIVVRPRLGSRFWTRVYVETHVRKQLGAITECLRLRLLDATSAEQTARLKALGEELDTQGAPLFRWRRLTGLVSRLPPVAAAIPVLSTAAEWPFGGGISRGAAFDALLVLAVTALVLWIVVVWPSVRLGFRVKRVIFSGGVESRGRRDLPDNGLKWLGFTAPHYYNDAKRVGRDAPIRFPNENIYVAENRVYRALRRRKPAEVPLDLLLRFWPYMLTAYSVFYVWGLYHAITTQSHYSVSKWAAYAVAGLLALLPIGVLTEAIGTYRERPH